MEAAAGGNEANRPLATPEEEALKRNTDCVYFLASPLTCKKGVECEYRHSEGARVNPRDCWFWLNGNCLNPKCSFRHPPLDGLIGTATTPSGTAPPPQLAFPTPAYSSATQASNKQNVPCYYFQKGVCLKGDRCSFVHGVPPIANPVLQQNQKVAALATKPSQLVKKTSWSLEKCTAQNIPEETVGQPVAAAISLVRPIARADTALANGTALKNSTHNVQPDVELPSRFERNNVPFGGGNASIRPGNQLHQPESIDNSQNDRDGSECLRESSPGFDVLVDDETEDAEYFHDEEEFKGISSHEGGRSLNAVDEYDSHHNTDYDSFSKLDRYSEIGEYGLQAPVTDRYAREHRRASSERMLERSSGSDRRRTRREENSNEMDGSDLRHRLKQRRLNGSRPAVNSDHHLYRRDDHYAEELRYGAPAHRGDQQHASCKGSMSKRLQGRITLPGRNSADSQGSMRSDREIDRGRNWGKPSPGGPTNHQGRLLDRINWQKQDCFPSDEKKSGTQSIKRDATGTLDFAGPRRLSELKGSKGSSNSEQISVGSNSSTLSREQRDMKLRKALGGHQESELVQFEGPKPLSVILKSKREAAPENVAASSDEEERKDKVDEGPRVTPAAASSPQIYHSSVSEEKGDETLNNTESLDAAALDDEEEEEGMIPVDDGEEQHFQSSEKNVLEMEDDAVEYDMEDPELEGYEHGDEEYYYEENEGEDYKTEDAADTLYVEDDEEVQEADDGDEFEKKLGAMLN